MAHPRDGLPLLQGAVEDAQQRETPEEGARVEVRHPGLQRSLVVEARGRDVREDRLEERLEVVVVGQLAVRGSRAGCRAGSTGSVDDGHIEQRVDVEVGHVVGHVGREAEQQVVRLLFDLGDPRVGTVGLVHQQDHRQLRLERLAQHEPGLRERTFRGVHEQHHAVDHRQPALDLAAEVRVPGGVDDVDGHRLVGVGTVVGDRRVLGEDRDALLTLQVVGVHRALLDVRVLPERTGLTQHRVHERRLAVVDVRDDRDVAEVGAKGVRHEGVLAE